MVNGTLKSSATGTITEGRLRGSDLSFTVGTHPLHGPRQREHDGGHGHDGNNQAAVQGDEGRVVADALSGH